jgi:hypothetical protein
MTIIISKDVTDSAHFDASLYHYFLWREHQELEKEKLYHTSSIAAAVQVPKSNNSSSSSKTKKTYIIQVQQQS